MCAVMFSTAFIADDSDVVGDYYCHCCFPSLLLMISMLVAIRCFAMSRTYFVGHLGLFGKTHKFGERFNADADFAIV